MRSRHEQRREDALAILGGTFGVIALVAYGLPQLTGALVGWLGAAAYPWRRPEGEDRRYWRATGCWALVAASALVAAYFLLDASLGADREFRRWNRNWGLGETDLSAMLDHPWAWVPLFAAAAFAGYGVAMIWRMR